MLRSTIRFDTTSEGGRQWVNVSISYKKHTHTHETTDETTCMDETMEILLALVGAVAANVSLEFDCSLIYSTASE